MPGNATQNSVPRVERALGIAASPLDVTVMVISDDALNSESDAVNRAMYVPAWVKVTVVLSCEGFAGCGGEAPPVMVQYVVNCPPAGNPSSVTVPTSGTLSFTPTTLFSPADTTGGAFGCNGPIVGVGVSTPTGGMKIGV